MTTTRPKRNVRNATPAPPVEDDATIIRTTLDRILYTVDVIARFDQTRRDIAAVHRGESNKTMAQVMAESRWHEQASKAKKECPLGSTKKKKHYEEDDDEDDDEDDPNVPSTSSRPLKPPKPTPEKKTTPSKAKLAAMKKKADAARRKAQRDAKKLEALGEKEELEEEDPDESFVGMPVLESAVDAPTESPEENSQESDIQESVAQDSKPDILEPQITKINEAICNKLSAPQPIVLESSVLEPLVQQPIIEEPIAQEPSFEEPAVQEYTIQETIIEELSIQESIIKETAEQSAVAPIIEEPNDEKMEVDETDNQSSTTQEKCIQKSNREERKTEKMEVEEFVDQESTKHESNTQQPILHRMEIDEITGQDTDKRESTSQEAVSGDLKNKEKIPPETNPQEKNPQESANQKTIAQDSIAEKSNLQKHIAQELPTEKSQPKESLTEALNTAESKSQALGTEEPHAAVPTIVDSESHTEKPRLEETRAEEPVMEVIEKTVIVNTIAEQPYTSKPSTTKPSTEQPKPEQPQIQQQPHAYQTSVDNFPLYTAEQIAQKPWLAYEINLYPLNHLRPIDNLPGRVWYPMRGHCKATNLFIVRIGPLTELETLDVSTRPEVIGNLDQEKMDLITKRRLECHIEHIEKKLLNPIMAYQTRNENRKQLANLKEELEIHLKKHALHMHRILSLPLVPASPMPTTNIEYYTRFEPTWYTSSRFWFDRSSRNRGRITQQDFLNQFQATNDNVILAFQRDMLEKARKIEEEAAAERIRNFELPLVYNLFQQPTILKDRMLAFRNRLARIYQYEDFERVHMTDPGCREIWKKLRPLPFENGVTMDEADEELTALISTYKKRFADENPVIPLPRAYNEYYPTGREIHLIAGRCLRDVVDTVVLRELTDMPNYPHRIPALVGARYERRH